MIIYVGQANSCVMRKHCGSVVRSLGVQAARWKRCFEVWTVWRCPRARQVVTQWTQALVAGPAEGGGHVRHAHIGMPRWSACARPQ